MTGDVWAVAGGPALELPQVAQPLIRFDLPGGRSLVGFERSEGLIFLSLVPNLIERVNAYRSVFEVPG